MLYSSFRIFMTITAMMGIFHMIVSSQYVYIFFPIVIIIWAFFSLFDEDDREYLTRNGINPDEVSWFFPEYTNYEYDRHHRHTYQGSTNYNHNGYNNDQTVYTTYAQSNVNTHYSYNNLEYKKIVAKCKRSVKITLDNGKESEK